MNKTAIKNFAVWARNKLIADITYKAGLLGFTEQEIKPALPQSTKDVQFFDIGTKEPYSITGIEIKQREKLAEIIISKAKQSDYGNAYKAIVEEVAYTWFNRLIAVRFMEVNNYLPSRIRVLSSESKTKIEPDLVTTPFDANLDYTPYEKDRIVQLTHGNRLDELFQMLFIKQCNALNAILPNLFEKTSDYTELLLNVSFTDKDGVVYRLVHDIPEEDFNVKKEGQVEIIGWLYQYYNTEPKDEAFALLKKNVKITKERIPAATQLFTPDWIVRYMVENSLGRIFIEWSLKSGEWSEDERVEKEKNLAEKMGWKYYLPEAVQELEVRKQLNAQLLTLYTDFHIEDVKVIDPCMGSGHILVYAFDVLMQIYESCGYSQRDAAKSILVHNIYGLDIDNRAYQLAYFAVMMKARQYNRRILDGEIDCHVYSIQESNGINRNHLKYFGAGMSEMERNTTLLQVQGLLDTFVDAKEYGSILNVENYNWELLYRFTGNVDMNGQLSLDAMGFENTKEQLRTLVEIGAVMARKYYVVVTNPPYMGNGGMSSKLSEYLKRNYPDSKNDLFAVLIEKCCLMTKMTGFTSMITQQSFWFLTGFESLRLFFYNNTHCINACHLGIGSFGADFGTVAFNIKKGAINSYLSKYLDLTGAKNIEEKQVLFMDAKFSNKNTYLMQNNQLIQFPNSAVNYWVSQNSMKAFQYNALKSEFVSGGRNKTHNDDKYLRLHWEIDHSSSKWSPYGKGGEFRKYYGNEYYVVDWSDSAKKFYASHGGLCNERFWNRTGITWSFVTSYEPSFRIKRSSMIYSSVSPTIFTNDLQTDLYVLGLLNSKVGRHFLHIISPTIGTNVGEVLNFPLIRNCETKVKELVATCVDQSKLDWDSFEISCDFAKHPLLRGTSTIGAAFDQWQGFTEAQFNELKANEEELNRIFIDIYGLQDELTPEVNEKDVTIRKADMGRDIRSFISYAVGCMFGRYSLDADGLAYAGGKFSVKSEQWSVECGELRVECDVPYVEYEGKLYHKSSFNLNTQHSILNKFSPDNDNIIPITDEEYLSDDIVGRFAEFVRIVYGEETLEQNLDFIAKDLGNKGNSSRDIIRNYFLRDFFKDHCKIYQKRPIYWLFDSGKADGFKALIYLHRYDENTIGNLRIDYLHRMQRVYESEITRMQETIDNSTNAREVTAAEKRKEKLIKQLKETKEYDEKIAHLALARIDIDLDDGVKVNYEKVQTGTDGKKLEVLAKI